MSGFRIHLTPTAKGVRLASPLVAQLCVDRWGHYYYFTASGWHQVLSLPTLEWRGRIVDLPPGAEAP